MRFAGLFLLVASVSVMFENPWGVAISLALAGLCLLATAP